MHLSGFIGLQAPVNTSTLAEDFASGGPLSSAKLDIVPMPIDKSLLISLAQQDAANGHMYRYSLLNCIPFFVAADSASLSPSILSDSKYALDAFGNYDQFWSDLADFYIASIEKNAAGFADEVLDWILGNESDVYENGFSTDQKAVIFDLLGTDQLVVGDLTDGTNSHVYGLDGDDAITGGAGSDFLDGGHGDDTLKGGGGRDSIYGMAGNDHLAGGAGDDILSGGEGNDTYYFNTGDGNDTILDASNEDRIVVNGQVLASIGELRENAGVYSDGSNIYLLSENKLIIKIGGSSSDTITIIEWNEYAGNFGIELDEVVIPSEPPQQFDKTVIGDGNGLTVLGFDSPVNWMPDTGRRSGITQGIVYDWQTYYRAADGTPIGHRLPEEWNAYFTNEFHGTRFNDELTGHNGVDWLLGYVGSDLIDGGAGNDWLFGHNARNIVNINYARTPSFLVEANPAGDSYGVQGDVDTIFGGQGNDIIGSGDFNDLLFGEDDNDQIAAGAGDDLISGGKGDDRILGDAHFNMAQYQFSDEPGSYLIDDVYFYAFIQQVHEKLDGRTYNDFIDGGEGDDHIHGEIGDDIILGGAGDDILYGDAPHRKSDDYDELTVEFVGESGIEMLFDDYFRFDPEWSGNDRIDGGSGNDQIVGGGRSDIIHGDDGDDLIYGDDELWGDEFDLAPQYHGDDVIDGGAGADTIIGGGGNDRISGGAGADQLFGDDRNLAAEFHGNDFLDGGDGNDLIWGGGGADTIMGGAGNDQLDGDDFQMESAFQGDDRVYGGDGDDQIWGRGGNDILNGESGNDILSGGDGDDTLAGGDGNDSLSGDAGNDILIGGAGNDSLSGGAGDDTYVIDSGSGRDFITDNSGSNKLVVSGSVRFEQDQSNAWIIFGASATDYVGMSVSDFSRITVVDRKGIPVKARLTADFDVQSVVGSAGGDVIEAGAFTVTVFGNAGDDTVTGSSGNNILYGDSELGTVQDGNDTIFGEGGDDTLFGGGGADALNGGDGNDLLIGGAGNDILCGNAGDDILEGGEGDDVYHWTSHSGSDRVVEVVETSSDVFHFDDLLWSQISLERIGNDMRMGNSLTSNTVTFVDWFAEDGQLKSIESFIFSDGTQKSWTEVTSWFNQSPVFVLTDGADVFLGDNRSETIFAGRGADQIRGGSGNDIIYGQDGNDTLSGENGDDWLDGGDGDDVIGGSGDVGNDTLVGGKGNDSLRGGLGDDTYIYSRGDGYDTIKFDTHGSNRIVLSDFEESEVSFRIVRLSSGSDVGHLYISGNGVDLICFEDAYDLNVNQLADPVSRLATVVLAGGRELSAADIWQKAQQPTAGNDHLFASQLGGQIYGMLGNDSIYGGVGADLLFGGDGDDYVDAGSGDDIVYGDDGDDTLYLRAGVDVAYAGSGNDVIYGDSSDTVYYARGNEYDILSGIRNLVMDASIGAEDVTYFRHVNDLVLVVNNSYSDAVVIKSHFTSNPVSLIFSNGDSAPSQFSPTGIFVDDTNALINWSGLASGTYGGGPYDISGSATGGARGSFSSTISGQSWNGLYGTSNADWLSASISGGWLEGYGGNDVLRSGIGGDVLRGGAGSDTYVFNAGFGVDKIVESSSSMDVDSIVFGEGINPSDVILARNEISTEFGIYHVTGKSLISLNYASDIDLIRFHDGTVWDSSFINSMFNAQGFIFSPDVIVDEAFAEDLSGTSGDDFILGASKITNRIVGGNGNDHIVVLRGGQSYSSANTVYGGGGDDRIEGSSFIDYLYGDGGDDYLDGGAGNDRLRGGNGNDHLVGGSGHDVYFIEGEFGTQMVDNFSESGATDDDVISVGYSSSPRQAILTRVQNDLVIINGNVRTIVKNHFAVSDNKCNWIGRGPAGRLRASPDQEMKHL